MKRDDGITAATPLSLGELRALEQWARAGGGVVVQGGLLIQFLPIAEPARADRVLRAAEERGWIIRQKYQPTAELQFFGVGGRMGRANKHDHECGNTYPCEYSWEITIWSKIYP